MAGVLAGPALLDCAARPGELGSCMREKVAETGLLPAREQSVAALEGGLEEAPAPDAAAQPDPAAEPVPPHLNFVRAEPDGSVVVAGSGPPGAEIEVFADGRPLGRATAESSGDWVVVPEMRLPPGGVELTAAIAGTQLRSAQSFVVVVTEDGAEAPLIVATSPEQARQVLEDLALRRPAPNAAPEPDEEAEGPAAAAEPITADPALQSGQAHASEAAELPGAAPREDVAATPEAMTSPEAQGAMLRAPSLPAMRAPVQEIEVAAVPSAVLVLRPPRRAAEQPQEQLPIDSAATEIIGDAPLRPPAGPTPRPPLRAPPVSLREEVPAVAAQRLPLPRMAAPAEAAEPAMAELQPTIDAIEIDGNANFFAGSGRNGTIIRLYVDDRHVGDAEVAGGSWLVEAEGVLNLRRQRVRADVLQPGTGRVAARAEVNFDVELPAEEAAPATAALPRTEPAPQENPETPRAEDLPPVGPEAMLAAVTARAAGGAGARTEIALAAPRPDPAPVQATAPETPPQGMGAERNPRQPEHVAPAAELDLNAAPVARRPRTAELPGRRSDAVAGIAPEATGSLGVAASPAADRVARLTALEPSSAPADLPPPVNVPRLRVREPVASKPAPTRAPQVSRDADEVTASIQAAPPALAAEAAEGDEGIPTLRARPIGDSDAQRFASGSAIIRRGDSLWSIARRVYGDGLKYKTIYRANRDQIRDPARIYPGQVFDLPLVYDDD